MLGGVWGWIFTASSKVSIDPSPASGFPRVLQGQEFSTLRGNLAESNESDTAEKSVAWPPAVDDEKVDVVSTSRRYGSESWMSMGRYEPTYSDLLSGFGAGGDSSRPPLIDQTGPVASPARKPSLDHEGKFNVLAGPWPVVTSNLSLNLLDPNIKSPAHGSDINYQAPGNVRYGTFGDYPVLQGHKVQHLRGNLLMPPPPPTQHESPRSRELMPKPVSAQTSEAVKPKDGDCKLFGFSLISGTTEPSVSQKNMTSESPGHRHLRSYQLHTFESDQRSEQPRGSKPSDVLVAVDDQEKPLQTSQTHLKDVQAKPLSGSSRSCTKVRTFLSINGIK